MVPTLKSNNFDPKFGFFIFYGGPEIRPLESLLGSVGVLLKEGSFSSVRDDGTLIRPLDSLLGSVGVLLKEGSPAPLEQQLHPQHCIRKLKS